MNLNEHEQHVMEQMRELCKRKREVARLLSPFEKLALGIGDGELDKNPKRAGGRSRSSKS